MLIRVLRAQVANQDCLLLDLMPTLIVRGTHVDAMLVIQATADRVALNDSETHDYVGLGVVWGGLRCITRVEADRL